jgi:hypothetical protein
LSRKSGGVKIRFVFLSPNGVGGAVFSPFAGIILSRLSGIISAFIVILRYAQYNNKSTPEIQTVKRTLDHKGRRVSDIF